MIIYDPNNNTVEYEDEGKEKMKLYNMFEVEFVRYSDGEISEYDGRNTILAVMMGGVSESSLDAVMAMLADEVIHLITNASEAEYYAANKDVLADQLKERIASAYYHEVTQGEMK